MKKKILICIYYTFFFFCLGFVWLGFTNKVFYEIIIMMKLFEEYYTFSFTRFLLVFLSKVLMMFLLLSRGSVIKYENLLNYGNLWMILL